MKEEAAQFLADLQLVASDYLAVDTIKRDLCVFALVNYGKGLSEYPYHRRWSSPSVEDYLDVLKSWVDFLTSHPEQYKRLPVVFNKSKYFEKEMEKERKSSEEIKWFKSHVKRLLRQPAILKMRMKVKMEKVKVAVKRMLRQIIYNDAV